jgi:hypothetical protein
MRRILKDPLVHFLALGVALFVLFEVVGSDDAAYDSKVINVDRDVLLTFLQYRARAFEPGLAAEHLDKMSDAELEKLIGDYVREEALHREALSLGVDRNDYVIKRRMIQSIEFITDGLVTAVVEISDEDIADYYEANRDDYYVEPYVTFTHRTMSNVIRHLSPATSVRGWLRTYSPSSPVMRPGTDRSSRSTVRTS